MNFAISELLPHKEPMILIDNYVDFNPEFIHTTVTIKQDSPFCSQNRVPSYVCLEYMAQSIGVWRGLLARSQNEEPKIGFLLSCRRLILERNFFVTGDKIEIFGQNKCMVDNMASFECWAEINKVRVASGSVNVFQPDDISSFIDG